MIENTSNSLKSFFNHKTIQPNFRFEVTFIPDVWNVDMLKRIGPMPVINDWHVLSVSIPSFDFIKEIQKYGPFVRSFPVLEYDGLEFKIDFEEDSYGTIGYFLNYLQRRIVDRRGYYTPPAKVKLPAVVVTTYDSKNLPVGVFTFYQVNYLQTSEVEYRQDSNESVKYSVVFNSDYMTAHFPRKLEGTLVSGKQFVDNVKNFINGNIRV